jgi:hypothetical protein
MAQEQIDIDHLADYPKTNDALTDALNQAGTQLNLKTHTVQLNRGRRISIATHITLEAYKSKEDQLYITNLSELFPLDAIYEGSIVNDDIDIPANGSILDDENLFLNSSKRLRPEYLMYYNLSISSDALTIHSAATRKERDANDIQAIKASNYLRDTWVPAFVRQLDEMLVRPIDSHSFTVEMHRQGVNVRYLGTFMRFSLLGLIARLSTLPHVRNMASIEMVARASKYILETKLRSAILHFKSVGATQIDEEMKNYTTNIFSTILGNSERAERYFLEKLKPLISAKFQFSMDFATFAALQRPALFSALQYHVF